MPAIVIPINKTVDISQGGLQTTLGLANTQNTLIQGQSYAHQLNVAVNNAGTPVELSGVCMAKFLRQADSSTVTVAGTINGNVASVEFPSMVYDMTGMLTITLFVGDTAIIQIETSVRISGTMSIVDPGNILPNVTEMQQIALEAEQAALTANTAASNANAATSNANTATNNANAAAAAVNNAEIATVNTLDANQNATVALQLQDGVWQFTFGLPRGLTGAAGGTGNIAPMTAETLASTSAAELQTLYNNGARALLVTNNATYVLLGLNVDGTTFFLGTNQSMENLLENSNFAVAQFGYGGNHGTQAYAADRWILSSGTVSFQAGQGLTLNGTIVQNLASTPSGSATAFVGMYSGQATISYSDGAVTIQSSGGVIAYAALYAGDFIAQTEPTYIPPDYATEMQKCRMYAIPSTASARYVGDGGATTDIVRCYIPTGVKMRTNPTAYPSTGLSVSARVQTGAYNDSNASISSATADANGLLVQISGSTQIVNSAYANCTTIINTAVGFFADL